MLLPQNPCGLLYHVENTVMVAKVDWKIAVMNRCIAVHFNFLHFVLYRSNKK